MQGAAELIPYDCFTVKQFSDECGANEIFQNECGAVKQSYGMSSAALCEVISSVIPLSPLREGGRGRREYFPDPQNENAMRHDLLAKTELDLLAKTELEEPEAKKKNQVTHQSLAQSCSPNPVNCFLTLSLLPV
jgi:hypothetical protein